jgi:hypothetical protein
MATSKAVKIRNDRMTELRRQAAAEDRKHRVATIPNKQFERAVKEALGRAPRGEGKAVKAIKETHRRSEAIGRLKGAVAAKGKGIELHPSEKKRIKRAIDTIKRARGRPRIHPVQDPKTKRGRGRPKSAKTIAKEKAIKAGTYVKRGRGRPKLDKPRERTPSHINSPILRKRGKGYTPEQVRTGIMQKKLTQHRTDSSQDGHNEFGLHRRGNTLASFIPKEGAVYKVLRRTVREGKNRSVAVTKTKKSDESLKKFKPFHSAREYTSPHLHVTEHIHHEEDPRKTTKTRLIATKSMGGAIENKVKTATGRKSKAWYPGFIGAGTAPAMEPTRTESSVGKLMPRSKRRAS